MGVASDTNDPPEGKEAFRCVGSLTIARAASTERELEAAPDPLTIDLSGVEKMDTVGAWVIYRTVRDRGARVVGAKADVKGLLDQVAEADRPARIRPEERSAPLRTLNELGEWVAEAGSTFVGLLGFLGSARGLLQLPALLTGGEVARPAAVMAQSVMAILMLLFVFLCVRSFINARVRRS